MLFDKGKFTLMKLIVVELCTRLNVMRMCI